MKTCLTITLAAISAAFYASAGAQPSAPVRSLLGPSAYNCKSNNPCSTLIQVSEGEVDNPMGCTVTWDYNGYTVSKWKKPKLVWVIAAASGGPYHFHPNDGVMLNSADENDPDLDLYDQGKDSADGQKFRWRDRNKRLRDQDEKFPTPAMRGIEFVFWVIRDGDGHRCAAGDPVVINGGE